MAGLERDRLKGGMKSMDEAKELQTVDTHGGLPTLTFSREQIDLLKRTVARGTTDDELALFLYTCKRTGLDPFAKQIYPVKRYDTKSQKEIMAIQVGIDGFRLTADRTGKYAPGKEPTYTYDKNGALLSATAYIKKFVGGAWHDVAATAFFPEYVGMTKDGKPNHMWQRGPHFMLAKCAEALAIRKAFPADLSGVYTDDEMNAADNPAPVQTTKPIKVEVKDAPKEDGGNALRFVPVEVRVKSGTNKNNKPYTKYGIVDDSGHTYGTFDTDLGKMAEKAKADNQEIEITYEVSGDFLNLTGMKLVELV